ncbi:MAG: hypothetical protein LBG05_06825 [Treponema sp.]|jgi:hypothetical protein|nr:hypothetical protein [Treponema sp.]
MRSRNSAYGNGAVFAGFFLVGVLALLAGGCDNILESPVSPVKKGNVLVILTSSQDSSGYAALASARTMLAVDPVFTGYELYVSTDPLGADPATYTSNTGSFQISLEEGTFYVSAAGFTEDKPSARTVATEEEAWKEVTVSGADSTEIALTLQPYRYSDVYGTLHYSLSWDGIGQIPAKAELLVESLNADDDTWNPIPISLMNDSVTAGSDQGTIILLQRETGMVKQSGSLSLPPGEYRLTTTVTMDSPYPPVSRTDIAHVFSNLTTPAAFHYASGDLIVTNTGTDTGSGFITSFNFSQTPGAVSIIGSNPGADGTRLIMVTVPSGTNLTSLTPVVECASGARITAPAPDPAYSLDGNPGWGSGDYSKPTSWTAEGRNGVTQQYTVVVTEAAADDCLITDIDFKEIVLTSAPLVDQAARSISVVAPYGTKAANPDYTLTPVFSYLGTKVLLVDPDDLGNQESDTVIAGPIQFMDDEIPARNFRVYAQNGTTKTYTVMITEALSGEAEITAFVFDGYSGYPGTVTQPNGGDGSIAVELPYGTPLTNLKPLIAYKGSISPASGAEQNFSVPESVVYTVISEDGSGTKTYPVTVTTKNPNTDTGIFDFVITNVPKAKVVIGTKPRADGKIPIIVSVPYATAPLIDPTPQDGPKTDLKQLIPKITLSNPDSSSISPNPNGTTDVIPFGNQNDYQEAVYTVTAQAGNTQDYVVVVARDVHYYYVKATGDDRDPDYNNGGFESVPFRTLAYAVYQAVKHNVDHIYVIGTLNDASEGGAWEDTSTTSMGDGGAFQPSDAPSVAGGASVFNLKGAGRDSGKPWPIYITGVGSNAVLQGASSKRVISITGGAHITFENIAIQGGGTPGNGGGMYIGENSTVKWKSGVISGNTAASGGGVYGDNSEFDLLSGTVSDNIASGNKVTEADFEKNTISGASIAGGGGVYVNGEDSLFWLAEGSVANNTTNGSGGGVLVNGSSIPDTVNADTTPLNFMMSAGTISGNTSSGNSSPNGGGGVYVVKGVFEMINGSITNNKSRRHGGGVFVWSRSLFYMDGNASITANTGAGSSADLCTRGITTMRGKAQSAAVYVRNYAKGSWNNGAGDEFTMMEGARATTVELAFAGDNRNYINLVKSDGNFFTGTDRITQIGLESHLTPSFAFDTNATIDGDWLNSYLLKDKGGNTNKDSAIKDIVNRFPPINFFKGVIPAQPLSDYKLDEYGRLVKK